MKHLRDWAEEHWDVLAAVVAMAFAIAVSVGLGVAYNVVATRLELSTPSADAVELDGQPAPPAVDAPAPHPDAPYS
jgi:hypothetical protein